MIQILTDMPYTEFTVVKLVISFTVGALCDNGLPNYINITRGWYTSAPYKINNRDRPECEQAGNSEGYQPKLQTQQRVDALTLIESLWIIKFDDLVASHQYLVTM